MISVEFRKAKHIHMFGIGGIGVSALARAFAHEGKKISGQDTAPSLITDELQALGVKISIGQKISAIPKDSDLIIYSSAINERDSVFLNKLEKLGKPTLSYAEALGLYSQGKYTIAIAGTHGKTTTTAMVAGVLKDSKFDPTVIVGSLLKDTGTNFVHGKGHYFVVEADDYRRQFLELKPNVLVITNIAKDHLDYYRDLDDIQSAFRELARKVSPTGYLVANMSDEIVRGAISDTPARIVDYREFMKKRIAIPFPGVHNQENAAAALAVAHVLNVPRKSALKSLSNFSGTWRRFDFKGKTPRGALVYDDYAHNPDKVRAAIAGFREAHPKSRITVIFQPHLYSRTKKLLSEFARSFDGADEVIVIPIFAARERRDSSISSEILVGYIQRHVAEQERKDPEISFARDLGKLAIKLRRTFGRKDVIVTMGAGDIYQLVNRLVVKSK